uniref:VTT domain-containing protein n=1 Tax=Chromera velia CCMP2878 TaxID=1169474 RepID=A0A0G4GSW4_9ALVE|mmetsp:Transcript_32824/g.65025  ORF Transcript_32824/g.65025 Transcript_32824/m.65025 type:complete len:306 (-) Transcript_32824:218-1135(-)|eukprot:Cvel_23224.t1-p1 / transcript=Cvel_23224.t1 / gene=Cvel_23224 / organism=Chromera_velia_CCMP2878 / gene_product=TVP38/TMEM64 family membrane protein slr0305, putative / transcript_product=TVP38/TMEM64 family membrane protein slr0305, putative / location=Cvel_scaffold2370:3835-8390(+) / protein_length=305 / sequence_SO=supercontig / SO=protein_coding / is_pseudo=false
METGPESDRRESSRHSRRESGRRSSEHRRLLAESDDAPPVPDPTWSITKVVIAVLVVIALMSAVIYYKQVALLSKALVKETAQHGTHGVIIFMAIYIVACVVFIPGALLTMSGAALFAHVFGFTRGMLIAFAAVFISAWIAAQILFLLGRYTCGTWLEKLRRRRPRVAAVDAAIRKDPITLIVLMRLSPVIPFSLLNFVLGGSSVRWVDFAVATLAIAPGTLGYVYVGAVTGEAISAEKSGLHNEMAELIKLVLMIVGALATLLVLGLITWRARTMLNERLAEEHVTHIRDLSVQPEEGEDRGFG